MTEGKGKPVPDFKRVLREVRIAHAERNDVIVEFRETEQMRLQLLAEALEGVFEHLPDDYEQLLLGLLPGQPPRYWVDATSFVIMGRDKRHYQFVKDTRLGRTVLAESTSVEAIAEAVTRYVAERIVERDQAIEADWLDAAIRSGSAALPGARPAAAHGSRDNVALVWAIAGFGLGMIAGMVLLVAYAWFTVG
jgi:hypothetical protein